MSFVDETGTLVIDVAFGLEIFYAQWRDLHLHQLSRCVQDLQKTFSNLEVVL